MSDDTAIIYEKYKNNKNKTSLYCNALCIVLCTLLCFSAVLLTLLVREKLPDFEVDDDEATRDTFTAAVVEYAVIVPALCRKVVEFHFQVGVGGRGHSGLAHGGY